MRTAVVSRSTKETKIRLELNLDGTGACSIRTGIGFFDHMLEQIARHGLIDLTVEVEGDIVITGGTVIVPGGEAGLTAENGKVTISGGAVREP